MVNEFVLRLLACQTITQLAHWQTESYAEHQALGEFYEKVPELADKFVESYVGAFGKDEIFEDKMRDATQYLEDELLWLNRNKDKIVNDSPSLSNIFDEITGLHMRTLYKLKNLR